jgi:hypothetical protein
MLRQEAKALPILECGPLRTSNGYKTGKKKKKKMCIRMLIGLNTLLSLFLLVLWWDISIDRVLIIIYLIFYLKTSL